MSCKDKIIIFHVVFYIILTLRKVMIENKIIDGNQSHFE